MEPTVDRLKQDQRMFSWLRKIYPTLTDADKEEARQIFPEVLESEDERIRGAILIYLDWLDGRKDCQPKGDYTIRDMFAYLEKQKEQTGKKWIYEDDYKSQLDAQYQQGLEDGRNEQKPAEWSEDDEQWLESIIKDYEGRLVKDKDHAAVIEIKIDFLKSLRQSLRSQPKREWTDAELNAFANCCLLIGDSSDAYEKSFKDQCIHFLIDLRDNALLPKPHWKPSEEQIRVFLKAVPVNLMPEELSIYKSLCNDIQKLM